MAKSAWNWGYCHTPSLARPKPAACLRAFPIHRLAHRWALPISGSALLSAVIDYDWLARKFQLAGGNIKNIVLNAAFHAAEEGGEIGMAAILHGARREFEKVGKLWNEPSPPISRVGKA